MKAKPTLLRSNDQRQDQKSRGGTPNMTNWKKDSQHVPLKTAYLCEFYYIHSTGIEFPCGYIFAVLKLRGG
jgi:hypothetical protein